MGKPTIPILYRLEDDIVEVLPYFLYEVSIYNTTKSMVELRATQFYKSDKFLNIKDKVTEIKYKGHSMTRHVTVLGVTEEFVRENKLSLYQVKSKKKKRK
jgi:hypothetical protein